MAKRAPVTGCRPRVIYAAELRALRDEGLLEFARGRGVTVSGTQEQGTVIERARELVRIGREHGYRVEELVEFVQAAAAPPRS